MRKTGALLVALILSALVVLAGCNTDGGGGLLYVVAAVELDDGGGSSALVWIQEGGVSGAPVADATVRVNGTELTYFFLAYTSFSDLGINAGDSVNLDIQRGGYSISATAQMPQKPTITAPAGGSVSEPVGVTWTAGTDPDQFTVTVDAAYTNSDEGYTGLELGTSRGRSIPTGTFDTSLSSAYVEVSAVARTTSLGAGAAAGSEFDLGNTDRSPVFDPEP